MLRVLSVGSNLPDSPVSLVLQMGKLGLRG